MVETISTPEPAARAYGWDVVCPDWPSAGQLAASWVLAVLICLFAPVEKVWALAAAGIDHPVPVRGKRNGIANQVSQKEWKILDWQTGPQVVNSLKVKEKQGHE